MDCQFFPSTVARWLESLATDLTRRPLFHHLWHEGWEVQETTTATFKNLAHLSQQQTCLSPPRPVSPSMGRIRTSKCRDLEAIIRPQQ